VTVILLCHGAAPEVAPPTGVDELASDSDLPGLVMILDMHAGEKTAAHS